MWGCVPLGLVPWDPQRWAVRMIVDLPYPCWGLQILWGHPNSCPQMGFFFPCAIPGAPAGSVGLKTALPIVKLTQCLPHSSSDTAG